jgi:CRP-like cAMP-binding protein
MQSGLTTVERTMFMMELDLFKSMRSRDVAHLAARAKEQHHNAGHAIQLLAANGKFDRFFVVVEGTVDLYDKDSKVYYVAEPGMEFGITGILGDVGDDQGGSAKARTDVTLLTISREAFFEAMREHAELAIALVGSLANYWLDGMREILALRNQLEAIGAEVSDPTAAAV